MATAALLRSLCCRDVATASLSAYRSLNSTVKSSLQGHHWVSLARPFSCIPVWNDVKGIDSVTTSSSVAEMEKKLGFEIRKHAEMVIWNIRMIKRYKTKIPGEIVKRIEDEVLDLRKASRGKSVFREPKSKMDENLACRNDSVVSGSHGDQFSDDEQGGGYFGGEASWDQSGSDIPIMNKILEEHRDKIPSDLAREVEAAIIDLQKATEGGNAEEINAKLEKLSQRLGSTCTGALILMMTLLVTMIPLVVSMMGNTMKARLLKMILKLLAVALTRMVAALIILTITMTRVVVVITRVVVVITDYCADRLDR
ncbi:uncharacterized protein LOC133729302 [Rosa rugosa]|uniref:uncharacterized protein LOC133729302 n=1 Tax=Rosa rugosa TaxID=74645 RepID=UPI002B41090E|nr:uncharacterized protein LOC133729302 [Rosa rugosa]